MRADVTGRSSTASRGSCATSRDRAGVGHPRRRPGLRRRAGGHRRGRPDRGRAGQPVHEPAAEPPRAGHPRRHRWPPRAPRVYVCNVATQDGETTGYDLAAHVEALIGHTAPGIVDLVLANNRFDARVPADWTAETVRLRLAAAMGSRSAAARPRGRRRPRTTPTTTIRPAWPRRVLACLDGRRRRVGAGPVARSA